MSSRKQKALKRTCAIPHEPTVLVSDELIKVDFGLAGFAVPVSDYSLEDVSIMEVIAFSRCGERHD